MAVQVPVQQAGPPVVHTAPAATQVAAVVVVVVVVVVQVELATAEHTYVAHTEERMPHLT